MAKKILIAIALVVAGMISYYYFASGESEMAPPLTHSELEALRERWPSDSLIRRAAHLAAALQAFSRQVRQRE